MPDGDSTSGRSAEDDSGGRIWRGFKALFGQNAADQSLRAQLEEVIDEHEESHAAPASDSKGDLSHLERQMVRNLLHFSEHNVDDLAVPRSDIVAIDEKASFEDLIALFAEHGHSRVPVYRDSLDDVIGMVHIRDLFAITIQPRPYPESWHDLIRQPRFVPQTMGVLDLLAEMRATRTHLAIVLDEYTGTEGLVTIEDLVEEIVGDIEDEHDDEPEALLKALPGGIWEADARAELDDVAETIDPKLAEVDEDVDTLGGLAFVLAEQVPQIGQILDHASGWRLEVIAGDEKRVTRLLLHPPVGDVEEDTEE